MQYQPLAPGIENAFNNNVLFYMQQDVVLAEPLNSLVAVSFSGNLLMGVQGRWMGMTPGYWKAVHVQ